MKRHALNLFSFVLIFIFVFGLGFIPQAGVRGLTPVGSTCIWTGATDNLWGTTSNWDCGHIPTTTDNAVFDGNIVAAPTVTGVTNATIMALRVIGNAAVTLSATSAATLNINGGGTGFQISSGSSLTLSGSSAITLAVATGTSGTVSGAMTVNGGAHRLTAFSASPVTFQSGGSFTSGTGFTGNPFGATSLNSIIFGTGSTFIFKAGSNPFGASQPNSVVTFQAGSLYSHQATGAPSFSGRTFANFELDSVSATINASGGGSLSVDNLTVTHGILNMAMTGIFNLKGNISVASGAALNFTAAGAATITLNGSAQQTISGLGTLTFSATETLALNNATGLLLQRDVTLGGPLSLTTGDINTDTYTLTLTSTTLTGTGDIIGYVKRVGPFVTSTNYPFNNAKTLINFSSNTVDPGNITVALAKTAPGGLSDALARSYTITPTTVGTFDASVQMGYLQSEVGLLDETLLRLWKKDSGSWAEQVGTVDITNDFATATEVTSFSDWGIAKSISLSPTNPSGTGSANPSTAAPSTQTLLNVAVTPGTNPTSTGLGVTCDLTAIGGSAAQSFVNAGGNNFNFAGTVVANTTAGSKSMPCTITDEQDRSGSASISLNIIIPLFIGTINGEVGDTDNGETHLSPYVPASSDNIIYGDYVYIRGVIYEKTLQAISNSTNTYKGFYIQNIHDASDENSETSDGLFVFMNTNSSLSGPDGPYTPKVGDEVILYGQVEEYYHMTELVGASLVMPVQETGIDLDAELTTVVADPPADLANANRYWERLQGARVQVPVDSLVLGGRNVFSPADAEIWLARSDSTVAQRTMNYQNRAFRDANALDDNYNPTVWDGNGYRILMGSLGIKAAAGNAQTLIEPARTFDVLTEARVGGLNYTFNKYRIEITEQPTFSEGIDPAANNPPTAIADRSKAYSIVDYNLENLYDFRNNPFSGCDFASDSGCPLVAPFLSAVRSPFDYVPASDAIYQARLNDIALQIINVLHNPDILMVQEVENQDICTVTAGALECGSTDNLDGKPDVLQELALRITANGGPIYDAAWDRDSSDLRGIAPAYLYRTERVQLAPASSNDPVLGDNPVIGYAGAPADINTHVSNPKTLNAVSLVDTSGCETTRVFPRAPDIALFQIYPTSVGVGNYASVYVINNHFKSSPDACIGPRTEQAKYNAAIVAAIQVANPDARIVVGGDLNVYPRPDDIAYNATDQLGSLYAPGLGLKNLWEVINSQHPASAYSYVYLGMAQTLDQMFVSQTMLANLQEFHIAHINSDFPAESPEDVARGTSDHDPQAAIFIFNEKPTDLSLSPSSVAEDAAVGSEVGTFSTTDPDAGDTFTYSLVAGTGDNDNASFSILADKLLTATTFDYEVKDSYSIRVRSTDSGGSWIEKPVTISITDVDLAPTDLALSSSSIAENSPVGTTIGTFTSTGNEPSSAPFTYSLVAGAGDSDNASFSISGDELRNAVVFDYEAKSSYSIRVRTTDADNLTYEKSFTITVTDVNEAPTNLTLSPSSVAGNMLKDTLVGEFTTTDPDAGDTSIYSLASGPTCAVNNAAFKISGNQLLTNAVFDYNIKQSYSINVRATDHLGLTLEKCFVIAITANNYTPILVSPAYGATLLSYYQPSFDWLDVPGVSSYTIQINRYSTVLAIVTVTSSNYTYPNSLPADATLFWRVKINKSGVPNPWSGLRSFKTPNPPSIPNLVAPGDNALLTDYTPTLDWSNSTVPLLEPGFDHYRLQVAINPAFTGAVNVTIDGQTNSQYTFPTNLLPNTRFYWRVSAYNTAGQYSAWSTVRTFRTAIARPVLVSPGNSSTTSNHKPTFSWQSTAGASSYSIQVSKYSNFSVVLVNTAVVLPTFTPATSLPSGKLYWRVRANGANGPSLWSDVWSFTITP